MKGLFIPEITAEMFRNGCLESIEALMADGEIYDIEYDLYGQSGQGGKNWIPVKTRPLNEEERKYYVEHFDWYFDDDEGSIFESRMPCDGQEVWVCSKFGNVWQDTCVIDEGTGLEGNGDWQDIVAWMPFERPEPYKEDKDEISRNKS